MTTSGSTAFNPARDDVINTALRMVGAYASSDNPRPEQVSDALIRLNMMLKAWQVEDHLWLKCAFQLPLVAGVNNYAMGPAGTAQYWPALSAAIARPTRLFNLRRKSSTGAEVPLGRDGQPVSRNEFMLTPNKTTTGPIVLAYYDPQLVNGTVYVWPTPEAGTTDVLIGDCDRPIQDMLNDTDTYDMPQECMDCLCYGLALRLAPEYGLGLSERQLLASEYENFKQLLLGFDAENTSVFFTRARY